MNSKSHVQSFPLSIILNTFLFTYHLQYTTRLNTSLEELNVMLVSQKDMSGMKRVLKKNIVHNLDTEVHCGEQ